MRKTPWIKNITAIVVVVLSTRGVLQAETPQKPTLSLESVLATALSSSPLVKEVNANIANRLADAIDTKLKANPQLYAVMGFPSEPAGESDKRQVNVSLSQSLRLSDFGTRAAVAEIMESSADVDKKLGILGFTQEISLSYAKLWILQEQQDLLNEQRNRANSINGMVSSAIARGALGRGEGGLFAAELKKLNAITLGLQADTNRERANLLRLSTVSTRESRLAPPDRSLTQSVEEILNQLKEGTLPIQSRYRLLAQVSSKRENLARLDAFPTFSPQLTYQRTEDGGYFVGGGFQVDLPLFNRNQAEITRRQGELAAARAWDQYSTGDSFRNEIALRLESLTALQEQSLTYEREVIPTLKTTLDQFNAQFAAGTGTALTTWQAQRELRNAQQELLGFWFSYFTARSELSILIGQQL